MEIKQQLKLSQQLIMTPQLQQAIKLLQMSRMELTELVQEELLENPMLEETLEARETTATDEASPSNTTEKEAAEGAEIDWERYLESQALQSPLPSARVGGDEETSGFEASLSSDEDLGEHLSWQVRMGDFVEDERRFLALVIGNLDDDGYLKIEGVPPEEVVPKWADEAG